MSKGQDISHALVWPQHKRLSAHVQKEEIGHDDESEIQQNDEIQKNVTLASLMAKEGEDDSSTSDETASTSFESAEFAIQSPVESPTPLPPAKSWHHSPLYLQPCHDMTITDNIKIGVPFEFETPLFKGRALLRFKDLATSDNVQGDQQYFQGRKRLHQVVVQGRFKKHISISDILTGSEFTRPLKMKPPRFANRIIRRILRRTAPDVQMDLLGDKPLVLTNYLASLQTLRADPPGEEPDVTSDSLEEENAALFGDSLSSKKRKKKALDSNNCTFDTDTVYTFETYDDSFDYVKYEMDFKLFSLDMTQVLDGEPFQIMAKTTEGEYLWKFCIWNEKLLRPVIDHKEKLEMEGSYCTMFGEN